jgi:hypothetical protein
VKEGFTQISPLRDAEHRFGRNDKKKRQSIVSVEMAKEWDSSFCSE